IYSLEELVCRHPNKVVLTPQTICFIPSPLESKVCRHIDQVLRLITQSASRTGLHAHSQLPWRPGPFGPHPPRGGLRVVALPTIGMSPFRLLPASAASSSFSPLSSSQFPLHFPNPNARNSPHLQIRRTFPSPAAILPPLRRSSLGSCDAKSSMGTVPNPVQDRDISTCGDK
ncbi:hypothetical protein Taro_020040, partial [Colocasia esculenta]|nr:hypothetical protein [Colocasia esculenta]